MEACVWYDALSFMSGMMLKDHGTSILVLSDVLVFIMRSFDVLRGPRRFAATIELCRAY